MTPLLLDIGWSEMMMIGVVALIVVGPKDLPMMFRKVGQFVGKAKGMARDFQRAMDQAADESGIKEVSGSLKEAANMHNTGMDDAQKSMRDYQSNYKTQKEVKKIDAAAEHAKRVKQTEDANKAAEDWPYEKHDESKSDTKAIKQKVKAAPASKAKKADAVPPEQEATKPKKTKPKKTGPKKTKAQKTTSKKPAKETPDKVTS